jgi:glycine/D-amino acid oxidase-like deaminating enzyme
LPLPRIRLPTSPDGSSDVCSGRARGRILYLRTTADRRAVIGGEDVDFQNEEVRDSLLPAKAAKLEEYFRRMFPAIDFQVACTWTGTFGESEDSLAFIGEPAALPGAYFALGYGGNGITYSMIGEEIIRDACLGHENPAARLFRIDR